jgi:NAD(P)-dependent dehydrogenase (short-subunit alcohol dehydrogenase family)
MAVDRNRRFIAKVALVTGAGMGIGAALAQQLAVEGSAVVTVDIDRSAAESVTSEIIAKGQRAVAVAGSVIVASDARRATEVAVGEFGGVDYLVNNAGVLMYGEAPEFKEED